MRLILLLCLHYCDRLELNHSIHEVRLSTHLNLHRTSELLNENILNVETFTADMLDTTNVQWMLGRKLL